MEVVRKRWVLIVRICGRPRNVHGNREKRFTLKITEVILKNHSGVALSKIYAQPVSRNINDLGLQTPQSWLNLS